MVEEIIIFKSVLDNDKVDMSHVTVFPLRTPLEEEGKSVVHIL